MGDCFFVLCLPDPAVLIGEQYPPGPWTSTRYGSLVFVCPSPDPELAVTRSQNVVLTPWPIEA